MPPARDPVYQAILKALDELPRDRGQQFEDCMADLLSEVYPGLVPVRGGGDFGYDGAMLDKAGEPYPLVSTIGQDVSGNLKRNLKQAKKRFPEVSKAVLATSQALTPRRQSNLRNRAKELGFRLEQIYEREAVAQLLYWNPPWRKDLLDVSGALPALSVYPPSTRRHVEIELVGREEDLEWLQNSSGDRILSGQPGSGKSYLLYYLTREGWGLFAASDSAERILDTWREQQPAVIILDDAHFRLELLEQLIRARRESGAEFELVATCWPGYEDQVRPPLQEDGSQIETRSLELLTRDEILTVYRNLGVVADDSSLRWLVTEADNRPGLAVLISQLWLAGEWQSVVDGDALREATLARLRGAVKEKLVPQVLAGFAVGGDVGMSMEAVTSCLELSPTEMQELCGRLGSGGVLRVGRERLSVWPRSLRVALLKSVFFRGDALDLPIKPFLQMAPSLPSVAETLVLAARSGVSVEHSLLREQVRQSGSPVAWQGMLAMPQHTKWVVSNLPGPRLGEIAASLDWGDPTITIQQLLLEAVPAPGQLHSYPYHPLRVLDDWAKQIGGVRLGEFIQRRRQILEQVDAYRRKDGSNELVAFQATLSAFTLEIEDFSRGAGSQEVLNVRWRPLSSREVKELGGLWQQFGKQLFDPIPNELWQDLKVLLWQWIQPEAVVPDHAPSDEHAQVIQELAQRMIHDLWQVEELGPGVRSDLRYLAAEIDLELVSPADSPVETFDLLFPGDMYYRDEEQSESDRPLQLKMLAEDWRYRQPDEVAEELATYEVEAESVGRRWPRLTTELAAELATQIEKPLLWIEQFLEEELPVDLLRPFLQRIVEGDDEEREQLLERLLDEDQYRAEALRLGLQAPNLSQQLLDRLLSEAVRHPHVVEGLIQVGKASEEVVRFCLDQDDNSLALATAIGLWSREPEGEVPEELLEDWRRAILEAKGPVYDRASETGGFEGSIPLGEDSAYGLRRILTKEPRLAEAWLRARLKDDERWRPSSLKLFEGALSVLSPAQRVGLLRVMPDRYPWTQLVQGIVEEAPEVYEALLDQKRLESLHLRPLGGLPKQTWLALAEQALSKGFSPEEVARATIHSGPHAFYGYGQEYWARWTKAFEEQEKAATNPQVQAAARAGKEMAERRIKKAEKAERAAALGRD
ncbi:MAG: hypothetical protein SX243_18815 [Acidobacteriota bacterium]|nr:hypothetical protein [Acidobacteriota bacterium]